MLLSHAPKLHGTASIFFATSWGRLKGLAGAALKPRERAIALQPSEERAHYHVRSWISTPAPAHARWVGDGAEIMEHARASGVVENRQHSCHLLVNFV
jgi:hypothetical protein